MEKKGYWYNNKNNNLLKYIGLFVYCFYHSFDLFWPGLFSNSINFGSFYFGSMVFSDRIVLWSTGAKIVTKEQYGSLHSMVENIVSNNNLPKPKIAVVNNRIPNAFATGKGHRSSVVAVTTGLLEILDPDELEGVLAHELTHKKSRCNGNNTR